MKKVMVVMILALGAIPLFLPAQEEEAIRETLLGFQKCLNRNDYPKAVGYLSRDFIAALRASFKKPQKQEGSNQDFLHQDPVEFVKNEMDGPSFENFKIVSIDEKGSRAIANLRPEAGKLVRLFLIKQSDGWKITLAPPDVFAESQKKDDARIKELDEKRHAIEWRQHLADDINADRWEWRH